jgi:hypothetical protein
MWVQVDKSNVKKGAMMIENHNEEVENKVEAQSEQIEDGSKPDWSKNVSSLKLNISDSQMNAEDTTRLETREPYVPGTKYKTDFRNVLVRNNEDQQNPSWRLTTTDSSNSQAGGHETIHMDKNTKHMFTLMKTVKLTAPLDSMAQQSTHNKGAAAYKVTCKMDKIIETNLEKVKNVDTESVNTNIDDPLKKTLNEFHNGAVIRIYDEDPERDEIKEETAIFAEEELLAEAKVLAKHEYDGEPNVQNSIVQDVSKMPPQEELLADNVMLTKYEYKGEQMCGTAPKCIVQDMPKVPPQEELQADNAVLPKYEYTNSGNVMTSQTVKSQVIDRRGETDNADMLANNAYQQTMYENSEQEGDADKPYPEIPDAPNTAPEKGETQHTEKTVPQRHAGCAQCA